MSEEQKLPDLTWLADWTFPQKMCIHYALESTQCPTSGKPRRWTDRSIERLIRQESTQDQVWFCREFQTLRKYLLDRSAGTLLLQRVQANLGNRWIQESDPVWFVHKQHIVNPPQMNDGKPGALFACGAQIGPVHIDPDCPNVIRKPNHLCFQGHVKYRELAAVVRQVEYGERFQLPVTVEIDLLHTHGWPLHYFFYLVTKAFFFVKTYQEMYPHHLDYSNLVYLAQVEKRPAPYKRRAVPRPKRSVIVRSKDGSRCFVTCLAANDSDSPDNPNDSDHPDDSDNEPLSNIRPLHQPPVIPMQPPMLPVPVPGPVPVSESKELPDVLLCCVCQTDPRNVLFRPCNHLCTCQSCADELKSRQQPCPFCRGVIESSIPVFMP